MSAPSASKEERVRSQLATLGIRPGALHCDLTTPVLYEEALRRGEGQVSEHGALVVRTGEHTGRAAKDKYVVRDAASEALVDWGEVNHPMTTAQFDALLGRVGAYLGEGGGKELFVEDVFVGEGVGERMPIRVVTRQAYHCLFARNMFLRPGSPEEVAEHAPRYTVLHVPEFRADPARDGTRSGTFVVLNFTRGLVLIGGTAYAGEIKKSIFTVMGYLLPQQGTLSMHCSANVGRGADGKEETAIFFGLSGTGKTTLSADPERALIGDDEHGWSDAGVFNLEGGCYAKTIRLSSEAEPELYATTRRFATLLENVVIDEATRAIDLDDDRYTENTRASYPIDAIPNVVASGAGPEPANVVLLTADAFGVLPPIARLSPEQAMYHFLSGYTAKVAGTEIGVKEPKATFSACFGAPFMPLHPGVYAHLLGERIAKSGARAWLVNTGWTGGPYGVGSRMKIAYTRAMLRAALDGALDGVPTVVDPVFGLAVPEHVPGVPDAVLSPRASWPDPAAYDRQARQLAEMFGKNFAAYESGVSEAIRAAAPRVG